MKITQKDIDCLIDISVFLKMLQDHPGVLKDNPELPEWHDRLRKIYILFLHLHSLSESEIKALFDQGIPDESNTAKAIRLLCPLTGLN